MRRKIRKAMVRFDFCSIPNLFCHFNLEAKRNNSSDLAGCNMRSTASFLKDSSYLLGKVVYSILIGVFGSILLVLFLTTIMHMYEIARFIPWIIALNTAIAGYCLLDKTRYRIKYKQISSIIVGILTVIITYMI